MIKTSNNKMILGYNGIPYSYTYIATQHFIRQYDSKLVLKSVSTFESLFKYLCEHKIDYICVPYKNSIGGYVNSVKILLEKYHKKISIYKTVSIPIHHCLLSHPKSDICDIQYIKSHPQAIKQCKIFLKKYNWNISYGNNTSRVAKEIMDYNYLNTACIANESTAKYYKLKILERNIQDKLKNITTFYIITLKSHKL